MDQIKEIFSLRRIIKCTTIAGKIISDWDGHGSPQFKVYCDEDIDGKNLESLSKMYFDMGPDDDNLISLPLIDLMVTTSIIFSFMKSFKWNVASKPVDTCFSKAEVFEMLGLLLFYMDKRKSVK